MNTKTSAKVKKKPGSNKTYNADIIIVGGGMVGLLLANALARHSLSIAIIESSDTTTRWNAQQFDMRVSAITRASQHILTTLGAWPDMEAMRICPFREMHVWDATGDGSIHFDCAEIGQDCLGHIVENNVIQLALLQQAKQHESISWFQPATPRKMHCDENSAYLELEDGPAINAKLIVGADGGKSWVRQQAAIDLQTTDYKQTAVVATVKTEKFHQETAWQRFIPTGPLAFLPLGDGYSSIVWSTTPEHADALLTMDDEAFKIALAEGFNHKLGNITETSARAKFPLRSQHARQYVKERIVLIGDAAHTIHPLAGQGVNLGFADAASLAEVLVDAILEKKDIGRMNVLRRYERWRKGENLAMLMTMTGFKTLFGNEHTLLKTVRNFGLNITDSISPLKNTIIRHAMGLTGDLPKLARCKTL